MSTAQPTADVSTQAAAAPLSPAELAVDVSLLRHIPLFATASPEDLAELAGFLRTKTVGANQTLFWIGDRGTDFFIIQHGQIELNFPDEGGKETQLAVLKAGAFFGELSLLDGGPRTATARALTPCTLLSLGRADFERFLRAHSAFAVRILTVMGQRQRDMLDKLRGINNVNVVVDQHSTPWHRAADLIARLFASPQFIATQILFLSLWMIFNTLHGRSAFDEYPFGFLGLVVSIESLFMAAFLLASQNKQGERDRIRADLDYQVNLKAHMEVMQLHQKVDRLTAQLADEARRDVVTPPDD